MSFVNLAKKDRFIPYVFLIPVALVLFIFILYPIMKAFLMSITNWNLLRPAEGHFFLGLENYKEAIRLPQFWKSVRVSISFTAFSVIGRMVMGLLIALLLNANFKGRGIVRAVMIIPWALPMVVASFIFVMVLDPFYGIMNKALLDLGLLTEPIAFLEIPGFAFASVVFVSIWKGFPFVAVALLAGLQGIPGELLESATVDGCGGIQKFRKITFPLLLPVWFVVSLLQVIWTLREFTQIFLMTAGGPGNATNVLSIDMYHNAFRFFKMGVASAQGILLLLFSLLFAIFYSRIIKTEAL